MQIKLDDPAYPEALHSLPNPPEILTTSGPLEPRRAVAIVGSRDATEDALLFAHGLAYQLARAGIVVVSGGALGIDGAAHRGALAAGSATWVVSPTGRNRLYPPEHRALFAEIAASEESRMLWSFPDETEATTNTFMYRNGVLAALSVALVVVQARYASGSRNAARWARSMGRKVWAVTAFPWSGEFCGSHAMIQEEAAKPFCTTRHFFKSLGLGRPVEAPPVDPASLLIGARRVPGPRRSKKHGRASFSRVVPEDPPKPLATGSWTPEERLIFSMVLTHPVHVEEIVDVTALPVPSVTTALLTLSLKDVVVEGPDGFFRRRSVA